MSGRFAVVIVVDRWGAGFVGPYGNTWLDTPEACRLAAGARLWETVLADSPDLSRAYRPLLAGRHARLAATAAEPALPALVAREGLRSLLVTDEPAVATHPLAAGFGARCVVPNEPPNRARELDATALGRLFARAIDQLAAAREPGLVWIHSQGMAGPWDAPLDLRRQFADEDDPEPPDLIEPPEMLLAEGFDPDLPLGCVQAYAGQVVLLDACLGNLLDALDQHPRAGEMLVALTSPRGYPLGEHLRVGTCDQALYGELLHVPLIIRRPGESHERMQPLRQTAELFWQVADWLGLPVSREPHPDNAAYSFAPGQRSIRTPAWFLREVESAGETRRELFAKPDDRWEANEVASRGGEVVELLAQRLTTWEHAATAGNLAELAPLAEILADPWR
ncbi:MAG: sulfatase-like hydrolase/transferase [Pirellulaceae bacterium]|nr:sulfatase-like hydrolase/transferase [Pirellulaceae bacterium]